MLTRNKLEKELTKAPMDTLHILELAKTDLLFEIRDLLVQIKDEALNQSDFLETISERVR